MIRGRGVDGKPRQSVPVVASLDGRSFPQPINDEIDRTVFLALGNENGRKLLEFLEGITLRTVLPPEASNETLREMEGQRRLVAMLKQRLKRAQQR